MSVIFIIGFLLAFIFLPTFRCALINFPHVVHNGVIDTYLYFQRNQYDRCNTGELVAYTGLFGRGKTLSAVHKVVSSYRRFDGKAVWCPRRKRFVTQRVKVISNVQLNIPYEEFVGLLQLVEVSRLNEDYDDENDTLTCTLVLGDEFLSDIFSCFVIMAAFKICESVIFNIAVLQAERVLCFREEIVVIYLLYF